MLLCVLDLTNNSPHQTHTVPRCLFHLFNVTLNSRVCHFFNAHAPDLYIHFHLTFSKSSFSTPLKHDFICFGLKLADTGGNLGTKAWQARQQSGLEGVELSKGLTFISLLAIIFFFFFYTSWGPQALLIFPGGMKIYKVTQSENSFSVRFLQLLETRDELCLYTRKPPFYT